MVVAALAQGLEVVELERLGPRRLEAGALAPPAPAAGALLDQGDHRGGEVPRRDPRRVPASPRLGVHLGRPVRSCLARS